MATTQNRTFFGGSTAPGSGVYPEDVKVLKVFANYAETDYDPLASSDTSVYIPTVDKHQYDDGNIVSIIDRVLAAGGSPIVKKFGAEFIYASGDASEYKFVNVSGDNITEMTIDRNTGTVVTHNNFLIQSIEVKYGVDTASDVAAIINRNGLPYVRTGDIVANLYKIEVNKYTFRTTHLRVDDDVNYLDIVDYIVNGSAWTTVTKTVSSDSSGSAYLKKVSSPASFDTTGQSGMQTVAGVSDVPSDGVYQVSVMLSVTPKTASATKSDLVFGFYGTDGIGMADHTFHAVVDDSQTFAQQLSFSTTLNLKAGTNSLKLSCDGLNTNYLVFVDDLTVAQLVNGVYHNGDDFDEVHTLTEASNFNNDDGFLVDGPTGGPRFMFWRTLVNDILRVNFQSNPEYLYAITDDEDRFLFGIKRDGSLEWIKGLPEWLNSRLNEIDGKVDKEEGQSLVNSIFANGVSVVSNDNYLFAIVDSEDRVLFGIDKDGNYDLTPCLEKELANKLFSKVDKVGGKGLINSVFADGIEVSSDENHLLIITDKLRRVLLSVTSGGVIEQLQSGLEEKVNKEVGKSLVDLSFSKAVSFYTDEKHLLVVTDSNRRCLFAIRNNGELELPFIPDIILEQLNNKVDKVDGKTLLSTKLAETLGIKNTTEYLYTITDNFERFIAGVKLDGTAHINKLSVNSLLWSNDNLNELREALAANGVNLSSVNQYDWSDANELHIQVPQLAIANIISTRALPQYKGDKVNAELEFWDLNGNYFRKKIIIDVQGNSTQWFPKKNFTFDICNDDWVGDDTFSLKFGRWVEQDSYHLKSFWVDMFRGGIAQAYYNLLDEIWQHKRGPLNVPWLQAKVNSDYLTNRGFGCSYNFGPQAFNERVDSGATCHPEGFPCLIHYNGSFWGVYSFAIKKHRKNYHMDKKNYNEILIDGVLHANAFWSGAANINWTSFELKNPKTLITMDGSKYDGDDPKELIDSSSPAWTNSKDQKNTKKTKQAIQALSNVMPQIINAVNTYGVDSQEVIDLYELYFDIDNLIDYILFSDIILDTDTGANNVLWTTWDGVKWYACPYDIDRTCGTWGGYLTGNAGTALLNRQGLPTYYIGQNATFRARLAARYAELRTDGIFEQNHLWSICKRWADAVGVDNYEKEWTKWPENIVNNNAVVNETYWQIVLDSEGNPELSQSGTWSADTNYVAGDEVFYGPGNVSGFGTASGYYKFVCVAPNTNQPPFSELRCRDSLWRLYAWFGRQLQAMDVYYNYNNT